MLLRGDFFLLTSLLIAALLLRGIEGDSAEEDYMEKCCNLGSSWAGQKLRCESFTGPVSGVSDDDQTACLETVGICCSKAFEEQACEQGKADAKAGLACTRDETGPKKVATGLGSYKRDCCEGCKLGILTGSSGKSCVFKKFSLGVPWDPAFMECCNEVLTSTTRDVSSTSESTSPPTSSTTESDSESDELSEDDFADLDSTTFKSDDLCQLMKGLLCSEICVPTPGSYYCKCNEGSTLQADKRTCKSNLTTTESQATMTASTPISSIGSSNATTLSSSTTLKLSTLTIDKKSAPPMAIASTFKMLTTGVKSRSTRSAQAEDNELNFPCPSGYRYSPTTEACEDIDECTGDNPTITCPSGTNCLNTNGSYVCENGTDHPCELGYRWNSNVERCEDVNECLEHIDKCLIETEICKNLEGSYECEIRCARGYAFNGDLGACLDINECNELTNVCLHPETICVNKPGTYECRSLQEHQQQLNESSQFANASDDRRPADYDGVYEGDIDECQVHQQPCASGEVCRNTIGGYDCIPAGCPHGFALVNDSCQDENECELGIHSCTSYERCQNTNGSFTCEKPRPTRPPTTTEEPKIICRKGFKPNIRTANCVDVDECIEGPGCRDHERCSNFQGGYDCFPLCGLGWYFDFHSKTCQDVDECVLGHHNCRQRTHYCRNTNGSYTCEPLTACDSGYRRAQNGSCLDIDECLESLHTCSRESHRYCVNREGGYECITRLPSCPRGFEYSLLTRQCEDLDECRHGLALCNSRINERCINLPGGYRCERLIPDVRTARKPACPSGYSYDVTLRRCSDIDECADGSHNCGEQKCYNLPGSFQCAQAIVPVLRKKTTAASADIRTTPGGDSCKVGSRHDPLRGGCVDVNECEVLEDACSSNEECINTPGSFECRCLLGFRRDELTQACVDINECQLENDCLASQRCDNTIGSYTCVRFLPCGTGYTLNAATEICEDDDECTLGSHDCGNGYHCKNTIGSYRCIKDRKKDSTTTIRPTTRKTVRTTWAPPTTAHTTPRFTTPRYTTTSSTTTTSTTITAAATTTTTPKPTTTSTARTTTTTMKPTTTSTRRPTTTVTTTPRRTTTTTRKPTTTTLKTTTTRRIITTPKISIQKMTPKLNASPKPTTRTTTRLVPITTTEEIPTVGTLITTTVRPKITIASRSKATCPEGFETGSVGQCIDINECHRNWNMCGNHRCINTLGSYRCEPRLSCGFGYVPDASGQCKDVDECAEGTHKCGPEQTCENRIGGYVCYCPTGYEIGDNHNCLEVNECERAPPGLSVCGSNSRCINTPGSFQCLCNSGFEKDPSGGCHDVDECRVDNGNCQQECYNAWGGHKCACSYGYRLKTDNRSCEDIDECTELKENNLCVGICDNTPGSYVCRCPDGYKLADDGRTCQDIDECSNGSPCRVGELCQNTRGGFRCNRIDCPDGYIKDPQRKNRCVRESMYCPANDIACFQRPAHYTFNYIAIVSMYPIPVKTGLVELFTMRGAYNLPGATVRFSIAFIKARAPPHVLPATESCFALRRPYPSQAVLVMTQSLQGPQDIELEFSMEIYSPTGAFAGSAVAKVFIVVTQFEF